jgi:membrane protein insertase Oxa1/YidC/SpoIIIJ
VIGYISDNLLLPILDFFYGLVPSYGLAIIALTVVIRLALFPLSAGSIRSARRMRIAQLESSGPTSRRFERAPSGSSNSPGVQCPT